MRRRILAACAALLIGGLSLAPATASEQQRWRSEAAHVSITRDDWGIAHVHGKTDADAVFGMVYAEAEDDFSRIETNYLTSLGRLAEAEGEKAVMQDLRMRLFIDPIDLKARYATSPQWLQALMTAWADGLNFYLATHPQTKPRVLTHFEPWMALSFTEGSIGGDIEGISLSELAKFYGAPTAALLEDERQARGREPTGSNGIAIAPAHTRDGHALLLINPHTSFFFRSELQVTSDQGLDAYGAATWGQFFLYQGFNARLGWMHTSSTVDAVDEFVETTQSRDDQRVYKYGDAWRPVQTTPIEIAYRTTSGGLAYKHFTAYRTSHGPIVRSLGGRWVSVALMFEPVKALEQSYLRTKARSFTEYMQVAALQANTSNNTVYADADGNIAYLHPQFIPRRDDRFDYSQPVDGADPATDWQGLHRLDQVPHLLNPPNGWIQSTNNGPYTAAGAFSPKAADYPRYMDGVGENARGLHAIRLLDGKSGFTLDSLVSTAYDSYQTGFAILLPPLFAAYDQAQPEQKAALAEQIAVLRAWDLRWAKESVATSLAISWGEALWREAGAKPRSNSLADYDFVLKHTTPAQKLAALKTATAQLMHDFGAWRTPWGEMNRFQRLTDDVTPVYSDAAPSLPVGFASAQWGSLASFRGPKAPGGVRTYGNYGNSFVAVVEFGPRIRARAVSAGGESGDPASKHFTDQAQRYADGNLREVYFYPEQLTGHTERVYHPGG